MDNPSNPKKKDIGRREKEMTEAILEYLAEHPRASDTLEGIAEWWIMRQQVRVEIKALEKVLGRLMKSGLLEKSGGGKEAIYHLKAKEDVPPAPAHELPAKGR